MDHGPGAFPAHKKETTMKQRHFTSVAATALLGGSLMAGVGAQAQTVEETRVAK